MDRIEVRNGESITITLSPEEEAIELAKQPTAEDIFNEAVQKIEDDLDQFIDDAAKAENYGKVTMSPTASCLSYAGFDNAHRSRAEAFGQWVASIWPVAYQIQADYMYGIRTEEPTLEIIISELPPMGWPTI